MLRFNNLMLIPVKLSETANIRQNNHTLPQLLYYRLLMMPGWHVENFDQNLVTEIFTLLILSNEPG